jgi:hypothetical protein
MLFALFSTNTIAALGTGLYGFHEISVAADKIKDLVDDLMQIGQDFPRLRLRYDTTNLNLLGTEIVSMHNIFAKYQPSL